MGAARRRRRRRRARGGRARANSIRKRGTKLCTTCVFYFCCEAAIHYITLTEAAIVSFPPCMLSAQQKPKTEKPEQQREALPPHPEHATLVTARRAAPARHARQSLRGLQKTLIPPKKPHQRNRLGPRGGAPPWYTRAHGAAGRQPEARSSLCRGRCTGSRSETARASSGSTPASASCWSSHAWRWPQARPWQAASSRARQSRLHRGKWRSAHRFMGRNEPRRRIRVRQGRKGDLLPAASTQFSDNTPQPARPAGPDTIGTQSLK